MPFNFVLRKNILWKSARLGQKSTTTIDHGTEILNFLSTRPEIWAHFPLKLQPLDPQFGWK